MATTRKCGGWCRPVKGKPHLRAVFIPMPTNGEANYDYIIPKGCSVLSHVTFKRKGVLIAQLIVDVSKEVFEESTMPDDWDYRTLMRVLPSARSVGRTSRRS